MILNEKRKNLMANQTNRGGQTQGKGAGAESSKHRGVRPGSTTQKKNRRQKQMERNPSKDSRVINER
jgi:hypothetical protein